MRIGGWARAAIDILDEFSRTQQPLGQLLKKWALLHRYAGSRDRHNISNIIYDALRLRGAAHALLRTERWDSVVLYIILLQQSTLTIDGLAAIVKQDKYARDLLQYLPASSHMVADIKLYADASVPAWLQPYFKRSFGCDYLDEIVAFLARPPIDLRVNLLNSSSKKVIELLADENIQVNYAMPGVLFIEQALRLAATQRVDKKYNLEQLQVFRQGYFEIQDLGSQIIAKLVNASPAMQILDYCAGAGGKALALAADMKNAGAIYVHDINMQRLAALPMRIQRAGISNIKFAMGAEILRSLMYAMDIVVVDAPCSGSGTWRRSPDRKWLFTHEELLELIKKQAAILKNAAEYVKPGGYLYYMTCSLFVEENDEQIASFLQQNSDFVLEPISAPSISCYNTAYGILLSPYKTGSDGFYISMLKRVL